MSGLCYRQKVNCLEINLTERNFLQINLFIVRYKLNLHDYSNFCTQNFNQKNRENDRAMSLDYMCWYKNR